MVQYTVHTFAERCRYNHGKAFGYFQEVLIMYVVSPIYGIGSGLMRCYTNIELWKRIDTLDKQRVLIGTRWRQVKIGVRKCTKGRIELRAYAGPVWKQALVARLLAWYCKEHPELTFEDFQSTDDKGNYRHQADHINMDCRCTWVGNIRLLGRDQHIDVYRRKWRGHIGIRKRPAAQR